MNLDADTAPRPAAGRGFVLGELLVAALLLVVAVSSLTALMYSVTRSPRARTEVECTPGGKGGTPKCVAETSKASAGGAKLLVSGCATRSGSRVQACNDSVESERAADGTTLRSRTDSASLELLPKKPVKRPKRPDLGFVR